VSDWWFIEITNVLAMSERMGRITAAQSDAFIAGLGKLGIDAETGKKLFTMNDHLYALWSVAWRPGGKRLATASEDNTVKIWDANTGTELLKLSGHSGYVSSIEWPLWLRFKRGMER
jgi:WD40 repeat protein